jgi:hypothetical protein
MESLDFQPTDDEALTSSAVRKMTPPTSDNTNHPVSQHPVSSFSEVLMPNKMMSLSLRADAENNQVLIKAEISLLCLSVIKNSIIC